MMNQNTPPSSLQITPNWMEQSIYRKGVLPSRRILTGWRNEPTGISWNSTKKNTKSHTSDRAHSVQQYCTGRAVREAKHKPDSLQRQTEKGQEAKDAEMPTGYKEKKFQTEWLSTRTGSPKVMEFLSLNVFKTQLHKTPSGLIQLLS